MADLEDCTEVFISLSRLRWPTLNGRKLQSHLSKAAAHLVGVGRFATGPPRLLGSQMGPNEGWREMRIWVVH